MQDGGLMFLLVALCVVLELKPIICHIAPVLPVSAVIPLLGVNEPCPERPLHGSTEVVCWRMND